MPTSNKVCYGCGHEDIDHFWSVTDSEYYCQGDVDVDCDCAFFIAKDWKLARK